MSQREETSPAETATPADVIDETMQPRVLAPAEVKAIDPQPIDPQPMGSLPVEAPIAGGPYRIAEPPEPALVPRPRPWPIFGPSLGVFAVLLWSFVVAGQFTTSWSMGKPLGQGLAIAIVFVATFAAWIMNVQKSRSAEPPRTPGRIVPRALGIGALSVVLFMITIAFATAIGRSSRGLDFLVAFVLVVLSTIAALVGPRLTTRVRPSRTHRERVVLAVVWIAGTLLTVVAGVDLAANG